MDIKIYVNVRENRSGNQEWTNPETLATLGAQDTGRRLTKQNKNPTQHRKLKWSATRTPLKTGGEIPGAGEV